MPTSPIGSRTVTELRDDAELRARVVELTGLSSDAVVERAATAHGRTHVSTLFDAEWPSSPERLGALTVAQARDLGLHDEIMAVTGATQIKVSRRLNERAGNTLVENAFADCWPSRRGSEASGSAERSSRSAGAEPSATSESPDAGGVDGGGIEDEDTQDGERLLAAKVRQTADQAECHMNRMMPRQLGTRSMRDAGLARGLRSRARSSTSPPMTSLQIQEELPLRSRHLNGAYRLDLENVVNTDAAERRCSDAATTVAALRVGPRGFARLRSAPRCHSSTREEAEVVT